MKITRDERTCERLCVGIEQQLVGIEAMAMLRLIGTMNAVAVLCAWTDIGEIAVPDIVGALRQADSLQFAAIAGIEQAQFDLLRICRKDRKIRADAVEGRSKRSRRPGRNVHLKAPEPGKSWPVAV